MRATRQLLNSLVILLGISGLVLASGSTFLAQDGEKPAATGTEAKESSEDRLRKIEEAIKAETDKRQPIPAFVDERDVFQEDELGRQIAKAFPHLDLEGKHNIRKVSNPAKGTERESYTKAMLEIVDFWLALDMGAMLNKIIVLQNHDNTTNPVLMVLAAHFSMEYGLSLDAANRSLSKALEIDENYLAAHFEVAVYFTKTGHADSALKHLNIVLKADEKNAKALLLKSTLYYQLREFFKSKDACIALLEGLPKDRKILRAGIELLSIIDLDRAATLFDEILVKYEASPQANDVRQGIARLAMQRDNYEEAISIANDLLASEAAKQDHEFAYNVRREVLLLPLKELIFKTRSEILRASDADKEILSAKEASYIQQLEASFRENIALDLTKFEAGNAYKGEAARDFASIYVVLKRHKDALTVLEDYDRSVSLIPARLREEIRERIARLRVAVLGRVDVTILVQKFDAKRFNEVADNLRDYVGRYAADKEKYSFADPELVEFLLKAGASLERPMAGAALNLLGIAGKQSESAEAKKKIRDAILARIAAEGEFKTAEQYSLLKAALTGLKEFQDAASALALIDTLEARFNTVSAANDGNPKKDDNFSDFWGSSISLVQLSHPKLAAKDFEPSAGVSRLRGSSFVADVASWCTSVRDALKKE